VPDATAQCPRCFTDLPDRSDLKFCPHCGLEGAREAALDTSPLDFTAGRTTYHVLDRLAVGSVCTIYLCRFKAGAEQVEGVLKVARDGRANDLVANEAAVLRRLHEADGAAKFAPFLPKVEASLSVGDGAAAAPSRQANVLRSHPGIRSPYELYTLSEVKRHCPAGLDGRDMAWIWRRLLNVLGFVHAGGVAHAAVLPDHVLIEPKEHKLVLIDWCCATLVGTDGGRRPLGAAPAPVIAGAYLPWYRRQGASRQPPSPGLDVAMGARCMIDLLGGDPVAAQLPPAVDPALHRYFAPLHRRGVVRCALRRLGPDVRLRPPHRCVVGATAFPGDDAAGETGARFIVRKEQFPWEAASGPPPHTTPASPTRRDRGRTSSTTAPPR